MSDAVEVLMYARDLINEGWCQEAGARADDGNATEETSESAQSWCLRGATARALFDLGVGHWAEVEYFDRFFPFTCYSMGAQWNDHPARTKQEVLDLFDSAIRLAKEEANR